MEFYHVVTERPMRVGQHILFDEEYHSGVYFRVMEKKKLVDEIYRFPEKYAGEELKHHTKVALRELALEEIRISEYSNYPSRMSSLYVSKTLEEAEKWFDFFEGLGRPTFQIVKIRVNANVFEGNANRCFDGTVDKGKNLELARAYWENDAKADEKHHPVVEVLVDGEIEVIDIIKDIDGIIN